MQANAIRGIHVFWIITGFFAVTFLVNAIFITQAVTSFPGEDEQKSYLQGLDYNSTLARRDAQARLGWTAQIGLDPLDEGQLVVRVLDAGGAPVSGLHVSARVHIPGEADETLIDQLRDMGAGEYRADIALDGPRGEVAIEARRTGSADVQFEAHKMLELAS